MDTSQFITSTKANLEKSTVFVIGAGFTRAFDLDAPLLKCDITIDELIEKYKNFRNILNILKSSREKESLLVNIELLLTRLYTGMPYDTDPLLSEGERKMLYDDISRRLINLVKGIQVEEQFKDTLIKFSNYIITNNISCITFNYDILLDEALWRFNLVRNVPKMGKDLYWHPDGGYGFFCKPADTIIGEPVSVVKDVVHTLLLKLHGSVNWRVLKGYKKPYPINALVHDESWLGGEGIDVDNLRIHLEDSPFIIPPVLDKSILTEQPVLKVIWNLAFYALTRATSVVFIGYSLPETDIATKFLFKESLGNKDKSQITVVTDKKDKVEKELFINRYKNTIPCLTDDRFNFTGAINWIKNYAIPTHVVVS